MRAALAQWRQVVHGQALHLAPTIDTARAIRGFHFTPLLGGKIIQRGVFDILPSLLIGHLSIFGMGATIGVAHLGVLAVIGALPSTSSLDMIFAASFLAGSDLLFVGLVICGIMCCALLFQALFLALIPCSHCSLVCCTFSIRTLFLSIFVRHISFHVGE